MSEWNSRPQTDTELQARAEEAERFWNRYNESRLTRAEYAFQERYAEVDQYQEDNWVEITEHVVPKQPGSQRMQLNLFEEIA